jgi:hypothetical protein
MLHSTRQLACQRHSRSPLAAARSIALAFTGTVLMLAFVAYTVAVDQPQAPSPTVAAASEARTPSAAAPRWTPPVAALVR